MNRMILLGAFFFAMSGFALGEIPLEKGNAIVGGQFAVIHQSGDIYGDVTTVSINPSLSIFIADGVVFGGNFELLSMSGDTDYREYRIGPRFGYYANIGDEQIKIRGSVYPYFIVFLNIGQLDLGYSTNFNTVDIGVNIGTVLMISDAIGADIGIVIRQIHGV